MRDGATAIFDRGRILRLGAWYASQHQYERAAGEYQRVAELDKADTASLRKAVELELRRCAWSEAAKLAQLHAERLGQRGWKLTSLSRYKKLSDILFRAPPVVQAQYGNLAGDVQKVRAALAAQRQNLATLEKAIRAAEQKGEDGQVIELSKKMLALQPDNPVSQARLAEVLCKKSMVDEAIPAFRLAAEALVELDRIPDAIRVVDRILHFRASTEDSLLAATLHLERGEPNDALRAVSKLSQSARSDPDNLDVLLCIGRAFDSMGHGSRTAQVRLVTVRNANLAGETELGAEILRAVEKAADADPDIRSLIRASQMPGLAPDAGQRSVLASVADVDLIALEEEEEESFESDISMLEDGGFEEISEIWVLPVLSRATRRALEDAEAFARLRLSGKAEAVLRGAIDAEPLAPELREALRQLLDERGDLNGYIEETVLLAHLFREKEFYDRARALCAELLARSPDDPGVQALAGDLEMIDRAQGDG